MRVGPHTADDDASAGVVVEGVVPYGDAAGTKADTDITAMLIRPDGYVAWASSDPLPDREELTRAIDRWF
ncbi:hypothetical protein ACFQ1S_25915 [Kibdelosporangium lantanae]|uniref:Uncharacterized protein n=1 Tax=Kibdelosporangium lantanae TaxID=1497396 RepID=A0ABW3MDD5_9PSEU